MLGTLHHGYRMAFRLLLFQIHEHNVPPEVAERCADVRLLITLGAGDYVG